MEVMRGLKTSNQSRAKLDFEFWSLLMGGGSGCPSGEVSDGDRRGTATRLGLAGPAPQPSSPGKVVAVKISITLRRG